MNRMFRAKTPDFCRNAGVFQQKTNETNLVQTNLKLVLKVPKNKTLEVRYDEHKPT